MKLQFIQVNNIVRAPWDRRLSYELCRSQSLDWVKPFWFKEGIKKGKQSGTELGQAQTTLR